MMVVDAPTVMIAINIVVTLGGFIKFALSYEKRITRLETILEHYWNLRDDESDT